MYRIFLVIFALNSAISFTQVLPLNRSVDWTSAGLIDDTYDKEGVLTKSVKYSILYMKAVKALQEAMERIETLEAKVTALENK